MMQVNVHEAKTHLSRLLEDVGKGDVVIIAKAGKPMAKLVPYDGEDITPRRIGFIHAGLARDPGRLRRHDGRRDRRDVLV